MKFHYDKKEDIFSIKFEESRYAESDEVQEGVIFDYNKRGKIISIEILDATKKLSSSFRTALLQKKIPLMLGA